MLLGRKPKGEQLKSIFLSRVDGSQVEGQGSMSMVIFFYELCSTQISY